MGCGTPGLGGSSSSSSSMVCRVQGWGARTCQRLGERHHVWCDAIVLVPPQLAGASQAHLHAGAGAGGGGAGGGERVWADVCVGGGRGREGGRAGGRRQVESEVGGGTVVVPDSKCKIERKNERMRARAPAPRQTQAAPPPRRTGAAGSAGTRRPLHHSMGGWVGESVMRVGGWAWRRGGGAGGRGREARGQAPA